MATYSIGHYYSYKGPVYEFNRIVDNEFVMRTIARTPERALSNMAYTYKRNTGRSAKSKITLNKNYLTELGDVRR